MVWGNFQVVFQYLKKSLRKQRRIQGPHKHLFSLEFQKSFIRPHFHDEHVICDQKNIEHFPQKMQSDKCQVTLVITGVIQETWPGKTISGTRNSKIKLFISWNQNVSFPSQYRIFWTLFFTIHFKYKEQIREVLLYFKRKAFRWIGKFINWEIKCFLTGAVPNAVSQRLLTLCIIGWSINAATARHELFLLISRYGSCYA